MTGPAAKRAINPESFVAFLTAKEHYVCEGTPRRRRLYINGKWVSENDARMIRRWRRGDIEGITIPAGAAFLRRYDLTPFQFAAWCATLHLAPTVRGAIAEND